MDELKDIYDRITYLRHKGMKMKDIAALVDFQPSVFSALYTTVIPAFVKNTERGMAPAEALDGALVWVNNVSKRRLLASLPSMKATLMATDVEPEPVRGGGGNPYAAALGSIMARSAEAIGSHAGTYMSYSMSSGSHAMKLEPYMIAPAAGGGYAEVTHNNAYGTTHRGLVMMNGASHIYLVFNENPYPQLALFSVCLRLPMYERPPFLRGIYTCFDYNYNPIARRILFVKLSDSTSADEFAKLNGCLKAREELEGQELAYYDYTCRGEDAVRLCNIPSPTMRIDDLAEEKRLLGSFNAG